MTFTHNKADLSETIFKYEKDNDSYKITYLDGSESNYISNRENESELIEQTMINQAIERQNEMPIEIVKMNQNFYTTGIFISAAAFQLLGDNETILHTLPIIGGISSIVLANKERKRKKELMKYKMFLEIYKDLPKINESKLLEEIEPDHMYQIPLNINNLDKYSYGEMKVIYKKFNSTFCSKNKTVML